MLGNQNAKQPGKNFPMRVRITGKTDEEIQEKYDLIMRFLDTPKARGDALYRVAAQMESWDNEE